MSHKLLKITVSFTLVAAFGLFNVGVPIVKYLCPLMNSENPMCDMSSPSNDRTVTITNPTPSCCVKYIVAERNTTPFLSIEKYDASHIEMLVQAFVTAISTIEPQSSLYFAANLSPPLAFSSEPLFILNSSLRI